MANYTAADIKELRERTGAGMLDVKKALDEADGDKAKATEILRVKGLKGVTKREGRTTSNGLVRAQAEGGSGTLVEILCETDFVAKGEKFGQLADRVLAQAVASTRPGGTCINVSIWGHPATFDVNSLVFSEIRLIGSLAYAGRHPEVIDLVRDGVVDVEQFITGRIALDDIVDQGFRELIDHKETNVKILVHP